MDQIADELIRMKKKVQKSLIEKAELEGRLKGVKDQAKERFGVNNITELKELRNQLEEQVDKLVDEVEGMVEELKEEFERIQQP